MPHNDSKSKSRSLMILAIIGATATIAFSMGVPPERAPGSSSAPVSAFAVVWSHDDSVPNTADTLSHERLVDEDSAPTF